MNPTRPSQSSNAAAMLWMAAIVAGLLAMSLTLSSLTLHPERETCSAATLRYGRLGSPLLAFIWIGPLVFGAFAAMLAGPNGFEATPAGPRIRRLRPAFAAAAATLIAAALGLWLDRDSRYYCLDAQAVTSRDGVFAAVRRHPISDLVVIAPACARTRHDAYLSLELQFRDGFIADVPVADGRGYYRDYPPIAQALAGASADWRRTSVRVEGQCPPIASRFGPPTQTSQ